MHRRKHTMTHMQSKYAGCHHESEWKTGTLEYIITIYPLGFPAGILCRKEVETLSDVQMCTQTGSKHHRRGGVNSLFLNLYFQFH